MTNVVSVIITKEGFMLNCQDEDKGDFKVPMPEGITRHLRRPCTVEDITLLDLFHIVAKQPDLVEFLINYSHCAHLLEYHEEAEQEFECKDLKGVEVYRGAEISCSIYDYTPEYSPVSRGLSVLHSTKVLRKEPEYGYDHWFGFHGIGPDDTGEEIQWGLEFSPIYEYSRLPLTLKHKSVFQVEHDTTMIAGNLAEHFTSYNVEYEFTLLDVLDAIYYEISFFGSPSERYMKQNELIAQAEEVIDDHIA